MLSSLQLLLLKVAYDQYKSYHKYTSITVLQLNLTWLSVSETIEKSIL